MDSIVCSCPKCKCKDEPELIVKGEAILEICPKCKVVRSKVPVAVDDFYFFFRKILPYLAIIACYAIIYLFTFSV